MPLTREEIKVCRDAFDTFDRDGSGSVDLLELKQCLSGLGSTPSDEELAQMIHLVDEDGSNEIHFAEFLKIIEAHKSGAGNDEDDKDVIEAYVALGGAPDKSGGVTVEKVQALAADFGLDLSLADLGVKADEEGLIEFGQFKLLIPS